MFIIDFNYIRTLLTGEYLVQSKRIVQAAQDIWLNAYCLKSLDNYIEGFKKF